MARYTLKIFMLICCLGLSSGARMPDWDRCNCYWGTWRAWNDCTETCYGYRYRDRLVWFDNIPSCQAHLEVCESDGSLDTGYFDWQDCNAQCTYGQVAGSGRYKYCQCPTGRYGTCCDNRVICSTPPTVTNGTYTSSGNFYGDTVTYQCQEDFQLVGDATRTCQLHSLSIGVWSGTTPRCLFVQTCRSHPCQNGATCEDMVGQYRCHCTPGWSGQNCELDIQPPVIDDCPEDITELTSLKTLNVTWKKPSFFDPHGFQVQVESNYHREWYEFPWGRFTVQYSAVKPSNGLRETCVFNISVLHKTQTAIRTLLPQPSSCNDTAGLGELASAYVDTFKASNFSSFCSDWADICKPQNVDVTCMEL